MPGRPRQMPSLFYRRPAGSRPLPGHRGAEGSAGRRRPRSARLCTGIKHISRADTGSTGPASPGSRNRYEAVFWSIPSPSGSAAGTGALFPSQIWRGLYLDDPRVFMDTLDESEADFSVDLDAGRLRLTASEPGDHRGPRAMSSPEACSFAAYRYRSSPFLSVPWATTVLQRFVDYSQTDPGQAEHIFRYFRGPDGTGTAWPSGAPGA